MAVPDDAAVEIMRRLANPVAGDAPVVAGESAVAGIVSVIAAMEDAEARALLGLDAGSRVLVFGTEGDTDPELYRELVGADAATVRADAA